MYFIYISCIWNKSIKTWHKVYFSFCQSVSQWEVFPIQEMNIMFFRLNFCLKESFLNVFFLLENGERAKQTNIEY